METLSETTTKLLCSLARLHDGLFFNFFRRICYISQLLLSFNTRYLQRINNIAQNSDSVRRNVPVVLFIASLLFSYKSSKNDERVSSYKHYGVFLI